MSTKAVSVASVSARASVMGLLFTMSCSSPLVRDTGGGTGQPGTPGQPGGTGPNFVLPPAAPGAATPGAGPCVNLQCQQTTCRSGNCAQAACPGGQKTTLRGRVFDPAGRVPLYNVVVYVPNGPLDPIPTGPTCDRCDTPISGRPVTSALSDTRGEFVLDNVPVGTDIPLVVQVGKWRREIKVPKTEACTETVFDDPNVVRLPRNRTRETSPRSPSPPAAPTSWSACSARSASTTASSRRKPERAGSTCSRGRPTRRPGRTTTSLNGGTPFRPAREFWDDPTAFDRYDMVILSCEGQSYPNEKSPAARALGDVLRRQGRPDLRFPLAQHLAAVRTGSLARGRHLQSQRHNTLPITFQGQVDTSFPKGNALSDWLVNVGASTTRGLLPIREGQNTVAAVNPLYSTSWIRSPVGYPQQGVQYFTFNNPVGAPADKQCGRVVFTDIHVSAGDRFGPPFPTGCRTTELSPQEKALEFMLFDLSSCVQPDTLAPVIP